MKFKLLLLLELVIVRQTNALTPNELNQITFEQKIGQQISRDLVFRDSGGARFQFRANSGAKPTLLVLGYFHCPMLCTFINNGLIEAMQELRLDVGRDFNVVDLSVDPRETSELAAKRKAEYVKLYGRRGAALGWHCLTGDETSIQKIASETGFHFAYDPQSNEYAHPSGVIVLTADGTISRYFFGVNFSADELRQAIVAAGKNENGSVIQRLALICYHYSPLTGKYGGLVMSILRASGVATVVAIALWIFASARHRPRTET
ncbi:MAG: SCO family protein [Verrucomicrobia bacterium]|nr:MAG: SCO family protein [Verrucomicrobiota bacterium]